MTSPRHVTVALAAAVVSVASASDWPQFLGPERTGISPAKGLVRSFPPEGPPVLWTAEVGPGFGGVAVRGGEVYLLDREPAEREVLRCWDLETGQELWRHGYEVPGRLPYPGSRAVPLVTADRVYTSGGFGHVTCFDRATRAPLWQVHLVDDLEGDLQKFGYSQSPLLHEGLVYVAPLGNHTTGLAALDADTGAVRWRSAPLGGTNSTPALVELGGVKQLLLVTRFSKEAGGVVSLDPLTGERLWEYREYLCHIPVPPPVRIDDARIFLTGGYRAGSLMLEITRSETGWAFGERFTTQQGAQIHRPILHRDHLFLIVNENWNDHRRRRVYGGLMCLTLDGAERWRTGNAPYLGRGSMILADGMLIIQDGYNGTLRLVEPTPASYTLIAEHPMFEVEDPRDDEGMWGPLALADGRLLMRSQDTLKCVDLRAPRSEPDPPGPTTAPKR